MEAVEINLPGGIAIDEQWHRSAALRAITGREEEFLLHEGRALPPAMRVTELLTRCLQRLGPVTPVRSELVRALSIGDREALLLHLRRVTLGERIACVLTCPACSEKMDLELDLKELLLPAYRHAKQMHEAEISDGEQSYCVVFRLPNGEDQEAAVATAPGSVSEAAEMMLKRCIQSVTSGSGDALQRVPAVVMRELPAKMAELDPQGEVLLDLTCPECATGFVVPFDAADYVCREVASQENEFYRGVHVLSYHYHWSEEAILNLSRRKRLIYLDLLANVLDARRNA